MAESRPSRWHGRYGRAGHGRCRDAKTPPVHGDSAPTTARRRRSVRGRRPIGSSSPGEAALKRPDQKRLLARPAAAPFADNPGHGDVRSLAGFYSGLLDGSLLEAEMFEQLTREHSLGEDKTLLTRTRLGLGCMLDQPDVPNATFGLGPKAFGHPGAGGSIGFADPEREVAFGFVTNTLGPYVLMDPRAQKLVKVLAQCL